MSQPLLSGLACLKSTIGHLAAAAGPAPGAATQGTIAGSLADYMIVQQQVAPRLQADCYRAAAQLWPAIEGLLASGVPHVVSAVSAHPDVERIAPVEATAAAVQKLKAIAAEVNVGAFDEFIKLSSEVSRKLNVIGTPAAIVLSKRLVEIETTYRQQFLGAVAAQNAATHAAASASATATRNVRTFDEAKLLTYIRTAFPGETDVTIEKSGFISGGFSKYTVSITLAQVKALPTQLILRGDASGTFGGVSVVHEYRLIKALHDHGVLVPRPLALDESGDYFGSPFLLMERCEGAAKGHMFDLPAEPNTALCHDIATRLASIHKVPLSALDSQIDGADGRSSDKARAWIDQAQTNWKALDMPSLVFEAAFDWLSAHADCCDALPRALVHADFGMNNLLIDNGRVSAILDWEFAHIGNPAYDLGYFYPVAQRLSSWEDFLQAYGATGMPVPDQAQLNYQILLAATRLGVMVCQAAHAFTSGAETGLAGAAVVGGGFYEQAIERIATALARVQ